MISSWISQATVLKAEISMWKKRQKLQLLRLKNTYKYVYLHVYTIDVSVVG